MKVLFSSKALAWMRKKGISSITIKEVVANGGCCVGALKEVMVEKGEPRDKEKRYAMYRVEDIDVYVAGNIPPKTEAITVILRRLFFNYLDVTGYEPKPF